MSSDAKPPATSCVKVGAKRFLPQLEEYAICALLSARSVLMAEASLATIFALARCAITSAARIPRMAQTINNSISVNPRAEKTESPRRRGPMMLDVIASEMPLE
jgi:hypothetical protein